MSRFSDDRQRILDALRKGPVRTTEWASRTPPDYGPPVLRLAARIRELQEQGWHIAQTAVHNHTPVYELLDYEDAAFNEKDAA